MNCISCLKKPPVRADAVGKVGASTGAPSTFHTSGDEVAMEYHVCQGLYKLLIFGMTRPE